MRLAARSTVVAGALVIAVIAAPAASARFDPGPRQHLSVNPSTGFVMPFSAFGGQSTTPRPEVHPNRDQRTSQTGAVAPPILPRVQAAQLRAVNRAKEAAAANHVPPTARYSSADLNAYATARPQPAAPAVTLKAPSNGFDWGDAAIGAAIAAAIALLITAGTLAARQRSQPRHP